MATGTSPSAADEALRTTENKANFQRLSRLLMRGGLTLLKEVFDVTHPPTNLPAVLGNPAIKNKLQTLRKNKVLSYPEWNCLYNPHGPGRYGKSADFDISLLCKLLRSICHLTAPATGWNNLPNSTDHSLEADLVRIKFYRNRMYGHNHSMEITDADFEKRWVEISEALLRIAGGISSAKRDEWKKAIERFFHDPLTPDEQECADELRLWCLTDVDTKDMLEKLDDKVEQMQIKQDEMQIELQQKHMEILIVLESLKASGSFDRLSSQMEGGQSPAESVETRIRIPQEQASAEGTAGLSTSLELQASQQNRRVVLNFWYVVYSFKSSLQVFINYLKMKLGVDVEDHRLGSLVITVSCSSLEVLEALWREYRTGHLNTVAEATLITAEILEKLDVSEVKLRTIISEEDYLSYKGFLNYRQGKTETTTLQEPAIFAPKLTAGMGTASSVQDIKLGDKIGDGAYGEVFKAVWSGKQVAAKRIRAVFFEGDYDGSIRAAFLERFKSEWELLSNLKHPNIVEYYTVILPPTPETPIIVTELLSCDLAKHIRDSQSKPKVSFSEVVKIMLDVAEALQYLHSQKPPIVHRDLASKNVLLTKSLHAKIADLGLAKVFPHVAMYATAMPGTPVYAAPETYPKKMGRTQKGNKAIYTEKIDIFSFGALMLETIIGHLPERILPDPVLEDGEIVPEYIRRSEDLEEMGPDHPLHNLVCQCFENIPEKRPSATEIINTLMKFTKEIKGKLPRKATGERVGAMSNIQYDHKFKVLVLGESGVGKTSIVARFLDAHSSFPDNPFPSTLESEDHFERLRFRDKSVHLHLVDVGGNRFSPAANFAPQIFRKVRGVVIVFDLTSQVSFLEVSTWLETVKKACHVGIPVVLVGNKNDDLDRWVDGRTVENFVLKEKLFYIEASAKTRENIDEIFSVLIGLMIENENQLESSDGSTLLDSLRRTLPEGERIEQSLIAERQRSPRHEVLDPGVIVLEDTNASDSKTGNNSAGENAEDDGIKSKKRHWCCLVT